MFVRSIQAYIDRHDLLLQGGKVVVALSGGADSVALLLVLKELGYSVEAAHCNFHLRGKESDRDEKFVVELCQREEIELHRIHFDTHTYASLHKMSIEMAARELRYCYFEQLRKDILADAICVAHHRDDQVETVLLNLIRGTGIHGLTGMSPKQGFIVRPLLSKTRKEIERFLQERQQSYVTDSTNLVDEVVRNKIRLNILPLLRTINPSVDESIEAAALRLKEVEAIYDKNIKQAIARYEQPNHSMAIADIVAFESSEALLFEWLQRYHFSPATIQQIDAHLQHPATGKSWSSTSHVILMDRDRLVVEPIMESLPSLTIPETGNYRYDLDSVMFQVQTTNKVIVNHAPDTACLDAQKVSFPLVVRPIQKGDRFVPFGMTGSKLISDFLTDQKRSLFERRRQLVVTDATGKIIWLVGLRPDQRCCVSEATSQMLTIRFIS